MDFKLKLGRSCIIFLMCLQCHVMCDNYQNGVDADELYKIGNPHKISDDKGYLQFPKDDTFLDGQISLVVEDCLEDGFICEFTPRSTIHIRSIKSGNAVVTHTRKWTIDLTEKLRILSENGGLYRIRVYQMNSDEKKYVSTFTKGCHVYESALSETLSVMVDGSGNSVIGVSLFTPISVCTGFDDFPMQAQHNTSVLIRSPTPAPVPDTATYIQKMEAIKSEKAEGKDNRSFLAKYWMYIVPIVLFVLISGGGQDGGR